MTQNQKWGLPCSYDGTPMRSRLETRAAYLFDRLDIAWTYEPRRFYFDGFSYLPDFHLPDHDQWIEAKGIITADDTEQLESLTKTGKEVILLQKANGQYHELRNPHDYRSYNICSSIHLIRCSSCSQYSFVPSTNRWHCRACRFHNGDRDVIRYRIFDTETTTDGPALNLADKDTVHEFITGVAQ